MAMASSAAADPSVENMAPVESLLQNGDGKQDGIEKISLRAAKKTIDDDEEDQAREERFFISITALRYNRMMKQIDKGVIETKFFEAFDERKVTPTALYRSWGFSMNGPNLADPWYKFVVEYFKWHYVKNLMVREIK